MGSNLYAFLYLSHLFIGHGRITSCKINRVILQVLDACSAPFALVVNLDVFVNMVVILEPRGVDRKREGAPEPVSRTSADETAAGT